MQNLKVENMISPNGNAIANQFIITFDNDLVVFQSYKTVIAKFKKSENVLTLDNKALYYSNTTLKYLKIFLFDYVSGYKTSTAKKDIIKHLENLDITLKVKNLN